MYLTRSIRRPVKGAVVHEDQLAIRGSADIQLKVVRTHIDGSLKCGQRIFGMMQVLSPMSDHPNLAVSVQWLPCRLSHSHATERDTAEKKLS